MVSTFLSTTYSYSAITLFRHCYLFIYFLVGELCVRSICLVKLVYNLFPCPL